MLVEALTSIEGVESGPLDGIVRSEYAMPRTRLHLSRVMGNGPATQRRAKLAAVALLRPRRGD